MTWIDDDDHDGEQESGVEVESLRDEWAQTGLLGAMDEIVRTFLDDTGDQMETLAEMAEDGNCPGAARIGHALKSAAACLHAPRLTELFKQIEFAGKAGNVDMVRALVPRAQFEFARVRVDLSQSRAA